MEVLFLPVGVSRFRRIGGRYRDVASIGSCMLGDVFALAVIETVALLLWNRENTSAAAGVLYLGLVLMAVVVLVEWPRQLVPATYEEQRVREEMFITRLCALGVELGVLICMVCSAASQSRRASLWFWSGWGLNLAMIGVMAYVEWLHHYS